MYQKNQYKFLNHTRVLLAIIVGKNDLLDFITILLSDVLSHELADGERLLHKVDLKFEEGKLIHDIGVTAQYASFYL